MSIHSVNFKEAPSLLLKGGMVFFRGEAVQRDVLISQGKIQEIGVSLPLTTGCMVVDVNGKHILPGVIDAHVHCRDPGATHKEDFFTTGCAAVSGGVTTIIDMPNNPQPTFTLQALYEKRELSKRAKCNVFFHFGTDGKNLAEIAAAERENDVVSTKVYLNETTGKYLVTDPTLIEGIFKVSRFLSLHAEGDPLEHALQLAVKYRRKVYVCHVSSEKDMLAIIRAREHWKEIYAEVCPHHLFLDDAAEKKYGALCCMKPSLKTERDRAFLWDALQRGEINTIATDHAPHTLEEKNKTPAPFGVPGLETLLPLLLNAVHQGKLSLAHVVQLTSTAPAHIFGLTRKGNIEIGYDADLTVVDLNLVKKVENEQLQTKCKWSPFNGWTLKGWSVMTFVRGDFVWKAVQ